MKKLANVIFLVVMLLSAALPVGAVETVKTEDSVTIPAEVLSCLDMGTVDTVFCVYDFEDQFVRCYYEGFAQYGDIDGVLANADVSHLQRWYFVKYRSGEMSVYTYDGTNLVQGHTWGSGWFDIHSERAADTIKGIDSEIAVEHIYYLLFEKWSAVCYKTNLGDYVYIRSGKEEYLMGQEPFMALQGELKDMAIKYQDWRNIINEPYHIKLGELHADLTPYDISSPDFDPDAPLKISHSPGKVIAIGSLVLLAVLIVCRVCIRSRARVRRQEEACVPRI